MNDLRRWRTLIEALHAYHGSADAQPVFGPTHTGHNSHTFGAYTSTRHGIFFSDNQAIAALYGHVGAYHLTVHHAIDLENDDNVIWDFVQSFDPHEPEQREIWLAARANMRDNKYWQMFEDEVGEWFVAYLKQRGFDSAKFIEYIPDDQGNDVKSLTTVVFDPAQVQRIP